MTCSRKEGGKRHQPSLDRGDGPRGTPSLPQNDCRLTLNLLHSVSDQRLRAHMKTKIKDDIQSDSAILAAQMFPVNTNRVHWLRVRSRAPGPATTPQGTSLSLSGLYFLIWLEEVGTSLIMYVMLGAKEQRWHLGGGGAHQTSRGRRDREPQLLQAGGPSSAAAWPSAPTVRGQEGKESI